MIIQKNKKDELNFEKPKIVDKFNFNEDIKKKYLIRDVSSEITNFSIQKSNRYDLERLNSELFVSEMDTNVELFDNGINITNSEVRLYTIGLDNNIWCFTFNIYITYKSPLLVANNKISSDILLFVESIINHLSSKYICKYIKDDYIKLTLGDECNFLKIRGTLSQYSENPTYFNTIKKYYKKNSRNDKKNAKNNFDIVVDEEEMVINTISKY